MANTYGESSTQKPTHHIWRRSGTKKVDCKSTARMTLPVPCCQLWTVGR